MLPIIVASLLRQSWFCSPRIGHNGLKKLRYSTDYVDSSSSSTFVGDQHPKNLLGQRKAVVTVDHRTFDSTI